MHLKRFSLVIVKAHHAALQAFKRLQADHHWQKVYLVTSALHLRRSVAVFAKEGVRAIPVGSDFQAYGTTPGRFSVIPTHGYITMSALYAHEVVGWWVYKIRGWI